MWGPGASFACTPTYSFASVHLPAGRMFLACDTIPRLLLRWGGAARGERMSGRKSGGLPCVGIGMPRLSARGFLPLLVILLSSFSPAFGQQRRERETNSTYAERRAKLASNIDGPIVLLGYTGREEESQSYI